MSDPIPGWYTPPARKSYPILQVLIAVVAAALSLGGLFAAAQGFANPGSVAAVAIAGAAVGGGLAMVLVLESLGRRKFAPAIVVFCWMPVVTGAGGMFVAVGWPMFLDAAKG